jgi:hypothetical protein
VAGDKQSPEGSQISMVAAPFCGIKVRVKGQVKVRVKG